MHSFTYHRPTSLDEAAELAKGAAEGRPLAGGMSLIPVLKLRLGAVTDLIDLNGISALAGITRDGGRLRIGAMTRHAEVAASPEVRRAIPALARLADGIGDVQVRNRGTIGGSICFNDPAADYPAGLLGLGATVHTTARDIAADDFFVGLYETALAPGELVSAISFPVGARAGWSKFPNLASRFAIVAAMVSAENGNVRVAVTGARDCVFRLTEMEVALATEFAPAALADLSVPAEGLNEDLHADPAYRAHLISVVVKRAVADALNQPMEENG